MGEVPHKEARRLFTDHVKNLAGEDGTCKGRHGLTAGELMDLFLDWIEKNRSEQTLSTREAFLAHLAEEGLGAQTRLHAGTSVPHGWN